MEWWELIFDLSNLIFDLSRVLFRMRPGVQTARVQGGRLEIGEYHNPTIKSILDQTNHTEPFEGYGIDTSEIIDCRSYQRCDQGRWTVVKWVYFTVFLFYGSQSRIRKTLFRCPEGTGYNPSMKRWEFEPTYLLKDQRPISFSRCIPARLHDTECNPPVTGPRCEEGAVGYFYSNPNEINIIQQHISFIFSQKNSFGTMKERQGKSLSSDSETHPSVSDRS